ncbi:MAG TPA: GerMN domain-containing protein [Geothermobacteraceae bacterium]|nr:GerMN domain-containing protein [Geothermobacteraceae bacterium]
MNLKRWTFMVLAVLLPMAAGCQKETAEPPQGSVRANQAYLDTFGQPPVPDRGECFARVGYYPLRSSPERLQAVPFFLFNIESERPLLFERLVNNPLALPADGPLLNPFPSGTSMQVATRGELLELQLKSPNPASATDLAAMAAALTETAGQYPEIKRVRLWLNGALWPGMPAEGFVPEPKRIVEPGPPRLLLVIGSWEADAAGPEEILADFDRPVTVESFSLSDEAGRNLEGEYFTSAFDMAVVLRPAQPEAMREGMPLRASWKVKDKLGRGGSGEGRFMLQRHDHVQQPQ